MFLVIVYLAGSVKNQGLILRLSSISLFQFKNYSGSQFEFTDRVVGICGKNGVGKTNLIDAIYHLSFTRSYFQRSDSLNVQHHMAGFRLEGSFIKNHQKLELVSVLRESGKKEFSRDGQIYDRLANHIGLVPAVMIAPDDVQIITGNSDERRRYLDTLFSQLDPQYLQELILHNKVLQQRNAYLRSLDDRRLADHNLLDAYDQQLYRHAVVVYAMRSRFIDNLVPLIMQFYSQISGLADQVITSYESQLGKNDYASLLKMNRERDLASQRTTAGIHKDDLVFAKEGRTFRSEASQGQRKSLLFALKLAEFTLLHQSKGFEPILLLDDVFEKLDEERIHNLLSWVCLSNQGQIFITDTHPERFKENINRLGIKYQLLEL